MLDVIGIKSAGWTLEGECAGKIKNIERLTVIIRVDPSTELLDLLLTLLNVKRNC